MKIFKDVLLILGFGMAIVKQADALDTELLAYPTAETLKKGEWYIGCGFWGFLPLCGFAGVGLTDRLQLSGEGIFFLLENLLSSFMVSESNLKY